MWQLLIEPVRCLTLWWILSSMFVFPSCEHISDLWSVTSAVWTSADVVKKQQLLNLNIYLQQAVWSVTWPPLGFLSCFWLWAAWCTVSHLAMQLCYTLASSITALSTGGWLHTHTHTWWAPVSVWRCGSSLNFDFISCSRRTLTPPAPRLVQFSFSFFSREVWLHVLSSGRQVGLIRSRFYCWRSTRLLMFSS